jgi:hypothetical protein
VAAHEFAAVEVAGTLVLNGTAANPIVFTSNELHPENQAWSGVIVADGGQVAASFVEFRHASPALTCLPEAGAALTNIVIEARELGIFTASPSCRITQSTIRSTGEGIVAVGLEPPVTHTKFFVAREEIKKIEN